MQDQNITAQVIDFNNFRNPNYANVQIHTAYMPVVFYYPVYYVTYPNQAAAPEPKPQNEQPKYENNVVSIYDYLGEI